MTHPAAQYAEDVVAGRIVAGRLVRLACERHLRDLEAGAERGLRFDQDAADMAITFLEMLPQRKGEWGGQPLVLSPWQKFRIASVFGWKWADGRRRFRKAYNEVARKNGKTTEAAGVGNLLAWVDDEPGADVYAAATKRDQAKICWGEGKWQMSTRIAGSKHPTLGDQIGVSMQVANMHYPATASKFEPLGCDADSADGLNIHGLIVDELHAWKDREYWAKLQTAQGARRQPLTWIITTAGSGTEGICREEHDYAVKVLEGVIEDDTLFAYIATVDDPDKWGDETEWAKANPNLGVSVSLDFLRAEYKAALEKPAQQSMFKRFYLDIWVEAENPWITLSLWDSQEPARPDDELVGRDCFYGLDLSSTTDLTALALVWPFGRNDVEVRWWFFMPRENVQERVRRDRVPYDVWIEQGHIIATPGRTVDYDFVIAKAEELMAMYRMGSGGIDPWNSSSVEKGLTALGLTVVLVAQNVGRLTAPTKEVERLLTEKGLRHGGNPVARWMASNAVAWVDGNENKRLDKKHSRDRIDGLAALVNAVSEMVGAAEEESEVTFSWVR